MRFAEAARLPSGGFGRLDGRGHLQPGPAETWITARMTYVFALAALRGAPTGHLVDHGVRALAGPLRDARAGGWWPAADRRPPQKRAYDCAFVLLAATTAAASGAPGAAELREEALQVVQERFWLPAQGLALDVWDAGWTVAEPYRGANANMHLVEALLTLGDPVWLGRAVGIAERLVHGHARAAHWRLPEHYDTDWRVLPDFNADRPADPFRPYGATVGHWLEWARLLAHLHVSLDEPPGWLLADAAALFDAAVREGWAVDGADGFVYTVDWSGRPVVRARMHWVLAEALSAAYVLSGVTGDPAYAAHLPGWWAYAERHLVDRGQGSWHHELDPANRPAAGTWSGKPDVYHAYQAVLLAQLPAAGSPLAAVLGG